MHAILDTSALIAGYQPPVGVDAAISAVSLGELHFGLLAVTDDKLRESRAEQLGLIEARFPNPLPLDDRVARAWGHLQAAVARRGGQPRRRFADLAIAATARVHDAVLITLNPKDLKLIEDLVAVRVPTGPAVS